MNVEQRHPRVKICGHTRLSDIETSVAAGADAIGVITAVPVDTPREVSVSSAAELLAGVPPLVTGVCVTMPSSVQEAIDIVDQTDPDLLQVHGGLTPAEFDRLTAQITVPVLGVVEPTDHDHAVAVARAVDALLVDSAVESGGGTGQTHDWTRTRQLIQELSVPVVVAGGLTPDNVAEAITTTRPFGVDTASGVESTAGIKDTDAVEAFIEATTTRRVQS